MVNSFQVSPFSRTSQLSLKLHHLYPLTALIELQPGEFEDKVIKSSVPVIVDFYANWCGPCKLMGPLFQQLADDYAPEVVSFVKVDTDVHEDTVDKYNIQGLPLFGLFVGGEMISSHSGALGKELLREFIKKNLKNSNINI
eukprot:gene4834-6774_t